MENKSGRVGGRPADLTELVLKSLYFFSPKENEEDTRSA